MFLLTFRWLKSKAGTIMPAHVKRFGWFNHLILVLGGCFYYFHRVLLDLSQKCILK